MDVMDVFKEVVTMRFATALTLQSCAFGFAAAAIVAVVLWLTPAPYESQAVIYVRSVDSGGHPISEQMSILTQRAISQKRLANIAEEFDLYPDLRAKGETDMAARRVRNDIRISSQVSQPAAAVTSVSFQDANPDVATQVTKALVSGILDEHVRLHELDREASGILPGKAFDGWNVELITPATNGERLAGPKPTIVVGMALVEGLQLGLIVGLLRGRRPAAP
jgi:uncharacterized protein involved in exopolysaccharide biosynthesis